MSAPSKRRALDNFEVIQAKHAYRDVQDDKLKTFITWADDRNFNLSTKVRVGREGSCAQYGMIATDDIEKGETLFQIPREMLLHPGTTEIRDLLAESQSSLESTSGWVPLLVSLMYEYNRPASVWRPYFDLVPDFNDLDLPMFWTSEERDTLLGGTGVPESVIKDLGNIETEFREVVLPFVDQHIDKFSPVCKDLEFYKKMVAFVMAYSFTEPVKSCDRSRDTDESDDEDDEEEVMSPPMMVPMADILNHVAKNNAKLTFEKDALKMVATRNIQKGEEVFNTYGELSNGHLLHMYGFAEPYPNNHYDEVIINGETLWEAAKVLDCNTEETLRQKKSLLESMNKHFRNYTPRLVYVVTSLPANSNTLVHNACNFTISISPLNEQGSDCQELLNTVRDVHQFSVVPSNHVMGVERGTEVLRNAGTFGPLTLELLGPEKSIALSLENYSKCFVALLAGSQGLLETTFVAGVDGILTEEEMSQALKIWTMAAEALPACVDDDGWIEDENDEESLLYEGGIGKLSTDKKLLLSRCAANSLKRYATTLEEDEKSVKKDNLTSRQRHALYVNIGQKHILKKLIERCS